MKTWTTLLLHYWIILWILHDLLISYVKPSSPRSPESVNSINSALRSQGADSVDYQLLMFMAQTE